MRTPGGRTATVPEQAADDDRRVVSPDRAAVVAHLPDAQAGTVPRADARPDRHLANSVIVAVFSTILVAHQSPSLDTLTTGVGRLADGQLGTFTQYPLELAAAMGMTIPVAVVFFVFQKYIMRTGGGAVRE
jgi:hypothetical protein